ncbi:hypothetical protein BHM03_00002110, partial [Ensete ventricosum]
MEGKNNSPPPSSTSSRRSFTSVADESFGRKDVDPSSRSSSSYQGYFSTVIPPASAVPSTQSDTILVKFQLAGLKAVQAKSQPHRTKMGNRYIPMSRQSRPILAHLCIMVPEISTQALHLIKPLKAQQMFTLLLKIRDQYARLLCRK